MGGVASETGGGGDGLARGVELFNRGEFWEAHEAWEGAWMPLVKGDDGTWIAFFPGLGVAPR